MGSTSFDGIVRAGSGVGLAKPSAVPLMWKNSVPSLRFQPWLPPLTTTLTSSMSFWPTSPTKRSPVRVSNENLKGFRKPYAQISGRAPLVLTKGLSLGMPYWPLAELRPSTSIRRILPSGTLSFWALPSPWWPTMGTLIAHPGFGTRGRLKSWPSASSAPPPSPIEMYSLPSGPNAMSPPSWLNCGQFTRMSSRRLFGSTTDAGLPGLGTRHSATTF